MDPVADGCPPNRRTFEEISIFGEDVKKHGDFLGDHILNGLPSYCDPGPNSDFYFWRNRGYRIVPLCNLRFERYGMGKGGIGRFLNAYPNESGCESAVDGWGTSGIFHQWYDYYMGKFLCSGQSRLIVKVMKFAPSEKDKRALGIDHGGLSNVRGSARFPGLPADESQGDDSNQGHKSGQPKIYEAVPRFLLSLGLVICSLLCGWFGLYDKRPRVSAALVGLSCLCWASALFIWWSLLL